MSEINFDIVLKLLRELLLYEFKNLKFKFSNQKIIKNNKFFNYIIYLETNELININKPNHDKTYYTLTDWGRYWAIASIKLSDCPVGYAFLNRGVYYDY